MKGIKFAIITLTLIMLAACGGPGENKAEYDGGFIWTSGDKYLALKEVKPSVTQISQKDMSISALLRAPKYAYVLEPEPSGVLSSSDVQGVFVKGDYVFKLFSLHKLEKKKLYDNEGFFENKGQATKEKPFYFAGKKIEVDKKKGDEGYFYKVKSPLKPGKYVGWINFSFWIFEVN